MQKVGIRGLKSHLSEYLSKVRAGERIVVTDRGVEVAEIVPISRERRVMQRLREENKVRWSGGKPAGLQWVRIKGRAIAETVIEDRRFRTARDGFCLQHHKLTTEEEIAAQPAIEVLAISRQVNSVPNDSNSRITVAAGTGR